MKSQELVERLITGWHQAGVPRPEQPARLKQYDQLLHDAATELAKGRHHDDLARTLHVLIREVCEARDAIEADRARRRGVA